MYNWLYICNGNKAYYMYKFISLSYKPALFTQILFYITFFFGLTCYSFIYAKGIKRHKEYLFIIINR